MMLPRPPSLKLITSAPLAFTVEVAKRKWAPVPMAGTLRASNFSNAGLYEAAGLRSVPWGRSQERSIGGSPADGWSGIGVGEPSHHGPDRTRGGVEGRSQQPRDGTHNKVGDRLALSDLVDS